MEVPDLIGVVQIASGGMHTCARTQAGEVYCWGRNESGAIGDGTNVDRTTPTLVPGIAAVDIAAGGSWFHDTTCAVLQSGAVRCWGSNGLGQVGDGTTIDRSLPASVPLRGAVEVATAAENSCARLASGDVYCWGNDAWGSVGNGGPDDGTVVTSPKRAGTTLKSHVIDLSMGAYYHEGSHACAIVGASADAESGHARCWGWGLSGQLGISSSPEFANVPKQVVGFGGSSVRSIVAGGSHSCSLRGTPYADDGLELWCWGANQHGQLGIGTTGGYEYISVFVPVNW